MTTSALTTPRRARRVEAGPVPFARLLAVEIRKLVDTRGGRTLLAVIAVATAGVIAVVLFTSTPDDLTFAKLAMAAAIPQGVLLPVMGALTATNEWSQRTALVTFSLEPRRLRVIGAKLAAAVTVGVLAMAAALAFGALANGAGMLWLDGNGSWAISGAVLAGAGALQIIFVIEGVAFGMALLNGTAAIVCLFAVPAVWSVVTTLVTALNRVAPWVDLSTATDPVEAGTMHDGDWVKLATACAVWLLLPLALGAWRITRKEVA